MNTEIKLIQKPVIQHALVEVGKSVTERIMGLNLENLVATEDTVKSLKTLRIELNKEFEAYEAQRKVIKEAVSNPYVEFNAVYEAEISKKYKAAVETLKDKIAIVEDKIKAEKKANVQRYFNELCAAENIDFLKFENVGLEINLSTSEKQYQAKCNEFVQRVSDDVLLIQSQTHAAEIMAEYKKTLNCSKAITAVVERKEAEKLEADRIKQTETNRRQTLLRGISMVFHDMTRSFNWVQDESVYITQADIETLSKQDFQKRYVELEAKTRVVITQSTPVGEVVGAVLNAPAPAQGLFSQPVPEPLPAPVEAKPEEKIEFAKFVVRATMPKLIALGKYMRENGYDYENI